MDKSANDLQCIICLECAITGTGADKGTETELSEMAALLPKIYNITELAQFNKKCQCIFYTHKPCIMRWLQKKPVCPYCAQGLYLPDLHLDHTVLNVTHSTISPDPNIVYTRPNIIWSSCILKFLIVLGGLGMIIMINITIHS
jgi:hypothetical protein